MSRSLLPEELAGRAFAVGQALESGVARSRLRAGDLSAPFHGVRSHTASVSTLDRARDFAPLLRPGDVFSHFTAAEILGLRMPDGYHSSALHVTSVLPDRMHRGVGVTGHEMAEPPPRITIDRLPITAPVTTWLQCAALIRRPIDVLVMADALLDRRAPLATVGELRQAVWANAGRRGQAALRWAVTLARPGTDSARETMLRFLLVEAGFPEPAVNAPIVDASGRLLGHGDLVYLDQRVILEYEGSGHREAEQFHFDIRRLDRFVEAGWRVIRVDKYLLAQPAILFDKVTRALARR